MCGPNQTLGSNRKLNETERSRRVQSDTLFLKSGVAAGCTAPRRYEKEYILGGEWVL